MDLNIGFIKSESQLNVLKLDTNTQEVVSNIIDTVEIGKSNLNLLLYTDENEVEGLKKIMDEENKFYPVMNSTTLGLDHENFSSLQSDDIISLYSKVSARWLLNNNIQTIEQIYGLITYLRDLWTNDRSNFFEELWYLVKTNLGTTDLNIIFHDVTEENPEKNEKAQLKYSVCKGKKSPEIFDAKSAEENVMQEYKNEFQEEFQITEYNSEKGELVASIRVGLSPILIMAKTPQFNQLQQSILIALFSGLKQS
tara:strand:- start:62395 stop:63153 length:759 start_codon:yes stop_codon:yes gene_type:complete